MATATRKAAVTALLKTLNATMPFFGRPAKALKRAYGPGKWTLREILVHLSDTETVFLDRLRRLAAEEKPYLAAFDQDRWAARLHYKERDLNLARAQYLVARWSAIELARRLAPRVDANTGTHSEAGTRTFAQVLRQIAAHNAHHLEQLRACAAGKTWPPKCNRR